MSRLLMTAMAAMIAVGWRAGLRAADPPDGVVCFVDGDGSFDPGELSLVAGPVPITPMYRGRHRCAPIQQQRREAAQQQRHARQTRRVTEEMMHGDGSVV